MYFFPLGKERERDSETVSFLLRLDSVGLKTRDLGRIETAVDTDLHRFYGLHLLYERG